MPIFDFDVVINILIMLLLFFFLFRSVPHVQRTKFQIKFSFTSQIDFTRKAGCPPFPLFHASTLPEPEPWPQPKMPGEPDGFIGWSPSQSSIIKELENIPPPGMLLSMSLDSLLLTGRMCFFSLYLCLSVYMCVCVYMCMDGKSNKI